MRALAVRGGVSRVVKPEVIEKVLTHGGAVATPFLISHTQRGSLT